MNGVDSWWPSRWTRPTRRSWRTDFELWLRAWSRSRLLLSHWALRRTLSSCRWNVLRSVIATLLLHPSYHYNTRHNITTLITLLLHPLHHNYICHTTSILISHHADGRSWGLNWCSLVTSLNSTTALHGKLSWELWSVTCHMGSSAT